MSARFRIRTSSGQEISFASIEVFTEFVRSGDLAPDDVVYDAETKEWSSAQTHPVVLQLQIEAEEAGRVAPVVELAPGPTVPEAPDAPPPAASLSMGQIGLDLAPAPDQLTPDQEAAVFVARMEAERAGDLDTTSEAPIQGFTMDQGGVGLGEQRVEPPPRRVQPRPAPLEREATERAPRLDAFERPEPQVRTAPPQRAKAGTGVSRYAPFVIVVLVLGGAAVYLGPELLNTAPRTGDDPVPGGEIVSDEPPPEIADSEDAVRRRAQERFLSTTQAALRGLDPIPEVWLRGQYLAAPSEYPSVRVVWDEYLTTIRDVRDRDDERYEAAYTRALDDARVGAVARPARLATALTDFRAVSEGRARHYDRVEALATAALRGHDALLQAEGTIAYEPASGQGPYLRTP